ncbi:MAG: hypothetical protein MUD14_00580 [Hydrococcus sp. Prado102]|jgi:hypothetical protein|nr:hypothetical protein [Hydrococcus sp. Prado102]
MSLVRYCDCCGRSIKDNNFLKASGWWGKKDEQRQNRLGQPVYSTKWLDDVEELQADICRNCFETRFSTLNALTVKITREELIRQRQEKYTNESMFRTLMKTVPGGIKSVTCEICGADCWENHLQLETAWITERGQTLEAQVCPGCFRSRFSNVYFQSL